MGRADCFLKTISRDKREPTLLKPAFVKANCASPWASVSFCGKQRLTMSPTAIAMWLCGEFALFPPRLCPAEVSESRCFAGSALWPSLLNTNLCSKIDLKNKAKQPSVALLINSENSRGNQGGNAPRSSEETRLHSKAQGEGCVPGAASMHRDAHVAPSGSQCLA